MQLYRIETKGLGDFYVVEKSPNDAIAMLESLLGMADYGFYGDRKILSIKILADEVNEFPEGKPNFSSKNNLILSTTLSHLFKKNESGK